ncbi:hypothetical protein VPH35_116687 [Triticum aestivum]
MAEEPSAKRHRGKTSDKSSNLDDVHVPGDKREYIKTLTGVELHDKEMLEIVCTSGLDKSDEMISRLRMKGGSLPKRLKEFLQEQKLYTFAGFSIKGDKRMLNKSGLEIKPKNFTDIQGLWRVPGTRKSTNPWTMLLPASSTHSTKA